MTNRIHKMTRRSFLSVAALAPIGAMGARSVSASTTDSHHSHYAHYDHVIGTSMDLIVWSRDTGAAQRAESAIIAEIQRLTAVLNTRDAASEISRLDTSSPLMCSRDLNQVFAEYDRWEKHTNGVLSIRPAGPDSPRNVDALGKAYILDRAVAAARRAEPMIEGLLLNIGGDIVTWGNTQEISIADPSSPHDNAEPIAKIALRNAAVATSGTSARGAHLIDARTGRPGPLGVSATVIARDAVSANALATTLCVTDAKEGLRLVESTPGAEALLIGPDGVQQRTSGFARFEKPRVIRTAMFADWPANYELTIALTMTTGQSAFAGRGGFGGPFGGGGRGGPPLPPQFVAVWVENSAGKMVRILAFWANNKTRYYSELATFYNLMGQNYNQMATIARPTRRAGNYSIVWDGLDDQKKPVPQGTYKIVVETNQEHGTYGKQSGTIACADAAAMLTLPMSANFDPVMIQYGPKQTRA